MPIQGEEMGFAFDSCKSASSAVSTSPLSARGECVDVNTPPSPVQKGVETGCADIGRVEVECTAERTAAVFFVGNRLMLDEGVAPAVYDELRENYEIPENVLLFDVGCMSLDMLPYVEKCDVILTVDAVDGTGDPAGTVYRFPPDAMARHCGAMASLHDLKLVDLFDAASLLGYEAEGYCLGMQIENMSPSEYVVGLTPPVHEAFSLLVETVVAELHNRGFDLCKKQEAQAIA